MSATATRDKHGSGRGDPDDQCEIGRIAEHWESVDRIRLYQSFGMLPAAIHDI